MSFFAPLTMVKRLADDRAIKDLALPGHERTVRRPSHEARSLPAELP